MKPVIVWTDSAEGDLIEIYTTIGVDNVDAAERVYQAIKGQALRLVEFPRLGARRSEIRAATRMLVQGMYLILYETHPDTDDGPVDMVEIVRIVHGNRDLSQVV